MHGVAKVVASTRRRHPDKPKTRNECPKTQEQGIARVPSASAPGSEVAKWVSSSFHAWLALRVGYVAAWIARRTWIVAWREGLWGAIVALLFLRRPA